MIPSTPHRVMVCVGFILQHVPQREPNRQALQ